MVITQEAEAHSLNVRSHPQCSGSVTLLISLLTLGTQKRSSFLGSAAATAHLWASSSIVSVAFCLTTASLPGVSPDGDFSLLILDLRVFGELLLHARRTSGPGAGTGRGLVGVVTCSTVPAAGQLRCHLVHTLGLP